MADRDKEQDLGRANQAPPGDSNLGDANPIVSLRAVSKRFPGVAAVDAVDLDILPGEVHVLAGENGAGKSTLMKLISQVEEPTHGEIYIDGEMVEYQGPRHAQRLGISMVYQELALAPYLSVAQNLDMGREPRKFGFLDLRSEQDEARKLLQRVGLDVSPSREVATLSMAEQQRVEIAKALAVDTRVMILDEPTATLTEGEIERLFELMENLTSQGIAIIYISHRLDEIFRIGDRVTVMRDGAAIDTRPVSGLDEDTLVHLMVGRDVSNLYPKPEVEIGEPRLRVEGVTRRGILDDCSFEVRSGEILGFAGLVGAGRTELARAVFGAEKMDSGSVELDGERLRIRSPKDAIRAGITYLTESRKTDGLALQLGIDKNITLAQLPMKAGFISLGRENAVANAHKEQLNIRTPSVQRQVQLLSGGNQQKVLIGRWLETPSKVMFFDEPGRGVDVGAKAEMFELLGKLAQEGKAIVLISSYLPELMNMCDRILVMREGKVAGEIDRGEFSEKRIVSLATGAGEEAA